MVVAVMRYVKNLLSGHDWKLWMTLILFILTFSIQVYLFRELDLRVTTNKEFQKEVSQAVSEEITQISYQPKRVHPVTKKEEKTDVEIHDDKPVVTVKVNGQEHHFDLLHNETQKFEHGKLLVNKTNTLTLDLHTPPPPKWRFGGEATVSNEDANVGLLLTRRVNSHSEIDFYYYPLKERVVGARLRMYL